MQDACLWITAATKWLNRDKWFEADSYSYNHWTYDPRILMGIILMAVCSLSFPSCSTWLQSTAWIGLWPFLQTQCPSLSVHLPQFSPPQVFNLSSPPNPNPSPYTCCFHSLLPPSSSSISYPFLLPTPCPPPVSCAPLDQKRGKKGNEIAPGKREIAGVFWSVQFCPPPLHITGSPEGHTAYPASQCSHVSIPSEPAAWLKPTPWCRTGWTGWTSGTNWTGWTSGGLPLCTQKPYS